MSDEATSVVSLEDFRAAKANGGWRVAQAIEAKMKFNATRAHKHGKEF